MRSRFFLGSLSLAMASVIGFACSDSLHLDPGATSAGGHAPTTSVSTGTGGAPPMACISSADCAFPTPVCDTIEGKCVGCLVVADCAWAPGTVCSSGACVCPKKAESYCEATPDTAPHCADLKTTTADCGACNHACYGACSAGKCVDAWEPTALNGAPEARRSHVAVSTGKAMIVWGGFGAPGPLNSGGIYDPAKHAWTATSLANAPSPRYDATAVWTGTTMIVFGGHNGSGPLGDGGIYDPVKNTWTKIAPAPATPSPRYFHTAVWSGSKMVVWGGYNDKIALPDGATFDPTTGTWTGITTFNVPSARYVHTAVWADQQSRMIVFGGVEPMTGALDDGGLYDVGGDTWTPLPSGGPSKRFNHSAVYTGQEMLVWGGNDGMGNFLFDGQKLNVQTGQWNAMNPPWPEQREHHTAVWAPAPASKMVLFGGDNAQGTVGSLWSTTPVGPFMGPLESGPDARTFHTAVIVGTQMIVWGGNTPSGATRTGGSFTL